MTSSYSLTKRKQMLKDWNISNFANPDNPLGGWEDHYITPGHTHECHPDYEAIPIGNPYGFMVCKRKYDANGKSGDMVKNPIDPLPYNGYNKYSADLYRPWLKKQIQITDPYAYHDRVVPNEDYLHQRDYLAREIKYDGIGNRPLRTPGNRKYFEYGFSYTQNPPYNYDITRLHQPFPIWAEEKIYHGESPENIEKIRENAGSVYSSVW